MRTVFVTTAAFLVSAAVAYQFRDELQLSGAIGSLADAFPGARGQTRDFDWPPKLNEPYPDLQLVDQDGQLTRLSEFKGKIILIEPIGMPCQACQAFCGGHHVGGFRGIRPQPGLPSLEESARAHGGFDLSNPRIVKVYLLLYNSNMQAPSPADAKDWADHFGLRRAENHIVLAGLPSMTGQESFEMIPGLQLIDRDFILRADSTGRVNQRHDLYRELLPRVGAMLSGVSRFTDN